HSSLTTSINDTYITFTQYAFADKATVPNFILPLVDSINATQVTDFVYYPSPLFTSVRPTVGRASGGTQLYIVGDNFGPIAGYHGARQVNVHFAEIRAFNTTVIVNNTALTTVT
ncbi:IPT/TIG domain-containing protein, partial [Salmonella sp. s51228]|uniref:IPT/TIG domain-containing protein n=1 Tax=Salmonella sp. s51228 TaxID=3159652 RepID=UPI0039818C2C